MTATALEEAEMKLLYLGIADGSTRKVTGSFPQGGQLV